MMRYFRRLFCALALLLVHCVAFSQVKTGDIVGIVTDPTGAVIPGVKVTVRNTSTNESRTAMTDNVGGYVFALLPPANYELTAEKEGFKTHDLAGIDLAVGDRRSLDIQLGAGAMTETVSVTSEATVLQTQTSAVQSSIGQTATQNLPVNNRNFATLAQLSLGSNDSSQGFSGGNGPDDRRPSSTVQSNGQYPWANNFQIDGANNNERFIGTTIVKPSIEAIQEIQIVTNLYPAELGRTAASVINLITKSGTNQFHGSLYEYFRNDLLDAPDVLAKKVIPYKQNQFGGSLGGPIVKERTFFFGDYEGYRNRQGKSFISTVPTAKMRNGDFSDLLLPKNGAISIKDPVTGVPYAGNIIPANPAPGQSGIDVVGQNLMNFYPLPNNADASLAALNYVSAASQKLDMDTFDLKGDHKFSAEDSLYARYSFSNVNSFLPGAYPAGDGSLGGTSAQRTQGAQANYDHVFSPRWIAEVRLAYSRYKIVSNSFNDGINLASQAGLVGSNYDRLSTGLPWFSVAGKSNLGGSLYTPELNTNNIYQIGGSATHTFGLHSLKMGGEARNVRFGQYQSPYATGGFRLVGLSGDSYADFITGRPFGPSSPGRQRELLTPAYRASEGNGFIQDDWRLRSNLTVNIGLRYDYYSPLYAKPGQIVNFNPATGKFIAAGQNGVSESAGVHRDWSNISPHLGFALSLPRGTVIRGGYGISYVPTFYGSPGVMRNGPVLSSWAVPTGWRFSDGMPVPPIPNSLTNPTGAGTGVAFRNRTPYVEQVNLTVQKELPLKLVGTVSYLANFGRQQYPPNSGYDLNMPANGQAKRPYASVSPNLTSVTYTGNFGITNYQALQASLQRRFTEGFGMVLNYVYSHAVDNFPYQPTANSAGGVDWVQRRENSPLDLRQRGTIMANYRLPFAKNSKGLTAVLAQGYQVNLIAQAQTSVPFIVTNSPSVAIPSTGTSGFTFDVPDMISDPFKAGPVMNHPNVACHTTASQGGAAADVVRSRINWFNPCAFAAQRAGTWGNAPINSLAGPNFVDFDFSFSKDFHLKDRSNLQFIGQVFNVLNHPNFRVTQTSFNSTAPASGGLGQASTTAYNYVARNAQLALKLTF